LCFGTFCRVSAKHGEGIKHVTPGVAHQRQPRCGGASSATSFGAVVMSPVHFRHGSQAASLDLCGGHVWSWAPRVERPEHLDPRARTFSRRSMTVFAVLTCLGPSPWLVKAWIGSWRRPAKRCSAVGLRVPRPMSPVRRSGDAGADPGTRKPADVFENERSTVERGPRVRQDRLDHERRVPERFSGILHPPT
jgi:hypothetical protein